MRSPHEATCRSIASHSSGGRIMSSINSISVEKLARLVGTPNGPAIVDVRDDDDFAADARLLPGSFRRSHADVADWTDNLGGRSAVIVCQKGLKLSHGAAAWLRYQGRAAEYLEDGFLAWAAAG